MKEFFDQRSASLCCETLLEKELADFLFELLKDFYDWVLSEIVVKLCYLLRRLQVLRMSSHLTEQSSACAAYRINLLPTG